jgi:hypothetical protein
MGAPATMRVAAIPQKGGDLELGNPGNRFPDYELNR